MKAFSFSTYHKYIKIAFPALILYGSLVGYLLFAFRFHQFFIWHIGLTLASMLWGYSKMSKEVKKIKRLGIGKMASEEFLQLSAERTKKYYILSSVLYLSAFSASYLYFFNM